MCYTVYNVPETGKKLKKAWFWVLREGVFFAAHGKNDSSEIIDEVQSDELCGAFRRACKVVKRV